MFRTRFTKTAVSMLAAALFGVLTVVGCSDDDDNGNGGRTPGDIGSHGHRLVGDWTFASDFIGYVNLRGHATFKPSGDWCESYFQKVDNFWIEETECYATWRADDRYVYMIGYDNGREFTWEYTLSENTLTIYECYGYDEDEDDDNCWVNVQTRGGNRPSGTMRSGDPTLSNTYWRMGTSSLEFGCIGRCMNLSPWTLYFNDNYYYPDGDAVWYTEGSKLFMLGVSMTDCRIFVEDDGYEYKSDCAYTVEEQIEFTYTHNPRNSLRLRNNEFDDIWDFDSGYYGKHGDNSETDKRQSPFRRPQPRRTLSKR